jgi:hypothetical protein
MSYIINERNAHRDNDVQCDPKPKQGIQLDLTGTSLCVMRRVKDQGRERQAALPIDKGRLIAPSGDPHLHRHKSAWF